jgi:hypothetical protein
MNEEARAAFDARLTTYLVGDVTPAAWRQSIRLIEGARRLGEPPARTRAFKAKDR